MIAVRAAVESDLPGILAIYNDVIANTTAVYSEAPVTLADRRRWWKARLAQGYPVLVTVATGAGENAELVTGFASFGDFRAWPCYCHTVEHSVHVRSGHRGKGLGRALIEALTPAAAAQGKHIMIAGVDADNTASLALHERLGFERVAHFREVGRKFGRWLDLIFLQRTISRDARG